MIIRELKLNPFAGLAEQALQFTPGLNVVVGPNEAGKSTIVNALKMALFVPTRVTAAQFNNKVSQFMPLAGGDTIQVELAFAVEPGRKSYRLFKSWGAQMESRLLMPGGGLLTDPQAVQDKLRELLVLKEGTYHAVLFAYQSHLGATLEALRKEPEPRHVTLEFPDQDSERAVRQDGLKVPGLLLSGGAKVSLGLAVRLSMAAHFLQDLDGFLVMDDPVVDLDDAGRQQAAVQVIQEFAKEKQIIVLTCKRGHAELLGGHRIDLTREECV